MLVEGGFIGEPVRGDRVRSLLSCKSPSGRARLHLQLSEGEDPRVDRLPDFIAHSSVFPHHDVVDV